MSSDAHLPQNKNKETMLSQISWTLFILAVCIAAVFYYLYVAIVYYPKETLALILGKKNKLPPGTAFLPTAGHRLSLMGPVEPEPLSESYLKKYQPIAAVTAEVPVPATQASTAPVPAQDEADTYFMVASDFNGMPNIEVASTKDLPPEAQLLGNVSDLMESIQTLLRVIEDGEGDQNDVIHFFPSLLAQYPLVSDSKYRYAINLFIHDHCKASFADALSLETINELWCFPYPPQAA